MIAIGEPTNKQIRILPFTGQPKSGQVPPLKATKASREDITTYRGGSDEGRWILIACEDWIEDGIRYRLARADYDYE